MLISHEVRAATLAGLLVTGSLLCTGAAAQNAASCDNACLKGLMDGYIDALSHRDATKLPVVKEVKYTENGRMVDLGEGFWHTAGAPIRYRDYIFDAGTGSVAAFTALKEYDATAEMFVRLKVASSKITEIETFVVRVGDQRWFAPQNLEHLPTSSRRRTHGRAPHTRATRRGGQLLFRRDPDRGHTAVQAGALRARHEAVRERPANDQRHGEADHGAAHLEPGSAARACVV